MLESDLPDSPPISPPGTSAFFPSLVAYIRNTDPSTLPLDGVILQSILLCLIAGNKHLILRTPEDDLSLVVKLASFTLTSVFAYPTHKLKIRPRTGSQFDSSTSNTNSFLRSLFLPPTSSAAAASQHAGSLGGPKSKQSNKNKKPQSGPRPYTRSISFPSDLAFVAHAQQTPSTHVSSASPLFESGSVSPATGLDHGTTRQPIIPPNLPHARAEPISHQHAKEEASLQLPRALVIMGLENASISSQRALTRVLAQRRVVLEGRIEDTEHSVGGGGTSKDMWKGLGDEGVDTKTVGSEDYRECDGSEDQDEDGVWNLPDGFITVYVCPLDSRERPAIHKSLLDKFAMSTTVIVHNKIRHAIRSPSFVTSPLSPSHSNSHFHRSLLSRSLPLTVPQVRPHTTNHTHVSPPHSHHRHHGQQTSVFPQPLLPPLLLSSLQAYYKRTYFSPQLFLYTSDLFSATRHHPQLDGTLLTAQALKDAEHLARARRVLGRDLTGMDLVRDTDVEISEEQDSVDEIQGGEGDESLVSDNDVKKKVGVYPSAPDSASYQQASHQQPDVHEGPQDDYIPVLGVSEADIARIVPRVVSHRLRVRDGPGDEILASMMFGAVQGERETGTEVRKVRNTIKDILVQILSEV